MDKLHIKDNEQIFSVIEDGYNTSYIDSVLICLFYKQDINFILEETPKKQEGFYLQELIKNKFVNPIQRNYSITSNIMNEIRNYSVICGWSSDGNITDNKDCTEYLCFLLDIFNSKPLQFEIFQIENNIIKDNPQIISTQYINLIPQKDDTIHNLLQYWINSKIFYPDENIIQCYKLVNIPQFIICHINRFDKNIRNNFKINIMKHIKFFNINDQTQKYIKWKIHGIICQKNNIDLSKKKNNYEKGQYYSICTTYEKNQWILFDNKMIPSFKIIDLKDETIKEKIMTDVVIVIYKIKS
jgi:hypothetical protein